MEKTLELEKAKYVLNLDDSWTNPEGQTFNYVSLKKVTAYKHKEKFQIITCRQDDWPRLKAFLIESFEEGPMGDVAQEYEPPANNLPPEDDVPF